MLPIVARVRLTVPASRRRSRSPGTAPSACLAASL